MYPNPTTLAQAREVLVQALKLEMKPSDHMRVVRLLGGRHLSNMPAEEEAAIRCILFFRIEPKPTEKVGAYLARVVAENKAMPRQLTVVSRRKGVA